MALGIESNSIAPQLIQNSGQALVQGIRQIGQQISGHLTEMQTKRDLAGLAQDMQGLQVESADFPVQLTQIVSRHPMASRDERGQMVLNTLGKAHGAWQASQADALAFQRQMQMQGVREQAATTRAAAAEQARASRTKVGNKIVDLSDPENPVTVFEGDPLNPPMPFQATPSGAFDKRTGTYGSPPPAPAVKPMNAYQQAQLRRAERKDVLSAINQEINQFDSNIASGERAYEAAFKREMDAVGEDKLRHEKDKTEVGKVVDALKAEKKKKVVELEKIRKEDTADAAIQPETEPELGPVPAGAAAPAGVLPPTSTVVPVSATQVRRVPVIDPQGNPMQLRQDQVDAALQAGWKLR